MDPKHGGRPGERRPAAPGLWIKLRPVSSIRPTEARVDLGAIARNLGRIRAVVGTDCGVYAVIKADGYGHGAVQVARTLEAAGARAFAVSLVEEGLELRRSGIVAGVLVLGAVYGEAHAEALRHDLTPVVGDLETVERFALAARRIRHDIVRIHVKVDTGMSRLGVPAGELEAFLDGVASFPEVEIVGLATHLASADGPEAAPTLEQLRRFEEVRAAVARRGISVRRLHVANSAGLMRFPESRYDAVRPGLALYGHAPVPEVAVPGIEPALEWTTRLVALHEVAAGTGVSYGGTFRARRRSRIATLPLGYADGYPRATSNRAEVLVAGRLAPVVGNVCMDMFMVDVTDIPEAAVGAEVVLVGRRPGPRGAVEITASDLARHAGTLHYEILTGISKRVPRVYVGE